MGKFTNEIKIGVFVVLAVLVGMVFWMKTQNFTADTYNIKTYFKFAGGIKENAVVSLSGIEVGRVEKIGFQYEPETKVEVLLSISKKAKVRKDSIAYISTAGFIGDAFVGITPGGPNAEFCKHNGTIGSEDPIEMRELMKRADGIAAKLDDTLVDVKELARSLNLTVKDNRDKIDNIVLNIEQTAINFNEFSSDIKKHPWKLLMKGREGK